MDRVQVSRRSRVFELDLLRVITSWSVVCIHVVSFTDILNSTTSGLQLQNALVTALHYSREVFMFVTAFALIYVYFDRSSTGKPFSLGQFWRKRGQGVLIPYVLWSIFYTWANKGMPSLEAFFSMSFRNILVGGASYQLYYILLTIQFYLLLPLFIWFLHRFKQHPWKLLSISFALQVGMVWADYVFLQRGGVSSPFWQFVTQYQTCFLFTYQFYFVLGGVTALYFEQVRAFLLEHGKLVLGIFIATLAALWLSYVLQIRIYHASIQYASSALQPLMVPYALAATMLLFWLACCWTRKADQKHPPRFYRVIRMLSDASFGLYLVHALILTRLLKHVVPLMPSTWPVALRVLLTYALTLGISLVISIGLTKIPILSMLVGRTASLKKRSKVVVLPQNAAQARRSA